MRLRGNFAWIDEMTLQHLSAGCCEERGIGEMNGDNAFVFRLTADLHVFGVHVHERVCGVDGGSLHARENAHAVEQLPVEEGTGFGSWVAHVGQGDAHHEGAVGSKGNGHVFNGDERAHHETGKRQQGKREGDLGDNKSAEEAPLGSNSRRPRTAERSGQTWIGAVPCGSEAEDEHGRQSEGQRAEQNGDVHGDKGFVGDGIGGDDAQNGLQAEPRAAKSNGECRQCQRRRLRR